MYSIQCRKNLSLFGSLADVAPVLFENRLDVLLMKFPKHAILGGLEGQVGQIREGSRASRCRGVFQKQIFDLEGIRVTEDHPPFNGIFQLSNVSGKLQRLESLQNSGGDLSDVFLIGPAVFSKEMMAQ